MPTYDLNQAKQRVTDYATGKYGRGPTDDEWGQIGQGIDYSQGVSDAQLQQAYGNVDKLASSYGAPQGNLTPGPPPANTTPPPATNLTPPPQTGTAQTAFTGVDPASTRTGLQAQSELQRLIGRALTPQELQQAQTLTGYTDPTGQAPLSGTQWNQLLQAASQQTPGSTYTPPTTPTPPPAATTTPPPTGPVTPPYGVNVPKNLQDLIGNLFNQQPASPIQSAYETSLLDLINKSKEPVSLDDPNLSRQSETYRASRQRGTERQRSALAERAAQTGTLGAGGFDTAVGNLYGDESRDIASKDTDIIVGEMTARRNQLTQALQLAQATGNAEAARLLQTQLGLLDASIQSTAIEQQGSLGTGDLIIRFILGMLNSQYNFSQLGSQNAYNTSLLNQNAIRTALGL
jgi:hypothetical protein